MFGKLLLKSFLYQIKKMLIIIFTLIISTSLSTTILNILYCYENHLFQGAVSVPTYGTNIQTALQVITIISLAASIIIIYLIASVCIYQRTNEFAVLRANGAYCFELQLLFMTQIASACLIGGIIGYFLGSEITRNFSLKYYDSLLINTKTIIPILVVLMLCVMFIGILPSLDRIKKINPAKKL